MGLGFRSFVLYPEVWRQAAHKLQRILDKFRCCRPPADQVLAVAATHEGATADVAPWGLHHDLIHIP